MAKIKKFQVIRVPVKVEYFNPILGRLFGVYVWLKCIRLKKNKITYICGQKDFNASMGLQALYSSIFGYC